MRPYFENPIITYVTPLRIVSLHQSVLQFLSLVDSVIIIIKGIICGDNINIIVSKTAPTATLLLLPEIWTSVMIKYTNPNE